MPRLDINKRLDCFRTTSKRFKVAFGGRGSGKSIGFADLCIFDAVTKGLKTGCFREFQSSIDDSVHSLLKRRIQAMGVQGMVVQDSKILMPSSNPEDIGGMTEAFKFKGLARNSSGVKSMDGFKRFWVEEAQFLSDQSLEDLTPTARSDFDFNELGITETTEIWFSANLRSMADPFSQRFFKPFEKALRKNGIYEDDLHLIVWTNYTENKFFPADLEAERQFDFKNKTRAKYDHIWLGEPYDEVENSIIPVEWFDAAIDAHVKLGFEPEGAIVASFDPSDDGGDAKGYALRKGVVFLDADESDIGDGQEGCRWALEKAIAAGADWFVWDGDGMGVLLKPQISRALEGKQIDYAMHKGSHAVENPEADYYPSDIRDPKKRAKNKDSLVNKRAQSWMDTARRFHNTYLAVEKGVYIDPLELISISSDIQCIDQLRSEICKIPLKPNNSGKIQIMSKKDMASLSIPSPNIGDSVNMGSYFTPAVQAKPAKIKRVRWG